MCFWGGRPGGWGLWGCSLRPRHGTACRGTVALCIECWRWVKDTEGGRGGSHQWRTSTRFLADSGGVWGWETGKVRPMGMLSMSTASHSAPRNHRAIHRVLTWGKRGRERGGEVTRRRSDLTTTRSVSPGLAPPQEATSCEGAGASIGDIHVWQRSHIIAHGAKRKRQ